jgi:hypothetical protein
MKSSARSDKLDLARELPTTAEDVEALRRARTLKPLDLEDYLRFLDQLPAATYDEQRAKRGPRGDRPFTLG